jgi:hypothetical protein
VLQRAENVQIAYERALIFSKRGRITVYVGKTPCDLPHQITPQEWQAALNRQRSEPVRLGSVDGRSLWQFRDKFYWDSEGLTQSAVHALLLVRGQRQRRRIEHAQAIVAMGSLPRQAPRGAIPDDLKQLVWTRDEGC